MPTLLHRALPVINDRNAQCSAGARESSVHEDESVFAVERQRGLSSEKSPDRLPDQVRPPPLAESGPRYATQQVFQVGTRREHGGLQLQLPCPLADPGRDQRDGWSQLGR